MSSRLRQVYAWLSDQPHQRAGLRALQTALGMMLLFRVMTEFRFAPFLWGPHGIGRGSSAAFLGDSLGPWVDRLYQSDLTVQGMLCLLALGAAGLVYGFQTRAAALLSLLAFRFFESRLPELGDGGDNVARLVLTYMLFALPAGSHPRRGSLSVWFHNVAVLAIGLQIGVVYLTSGVLKLTGERWSNGTALYTISQVEWFSNPHFRELFHNPTITALATYVTVFFQIWFPVVVLTRLRPLWLGVGILLHLGIALFMGLIGFSLAMIGLELFLVTDAEYRGVRAAYERGQRHLRRGWSSARLLLPDRPSLLQLWNPRRFRGKVAR
ncbi:MAG TPA: hypothetical protein VFS67_30960 [Polyangiaceae bacterium]|nr:hypothetical protein [Polyangiaceae bacterium]